MYVLSAGMFCVGEGLIFKNEQERRKPHREGKTDGDESEMCKTRAEVGVGRWEWEPKMEDLRLPKSRVHTPLRENNVRGILEP